MVNTKPKVALTKELVYIQIVKMNILSGIPVITWSQVCTKQDWAIFYVGLKLTHNISTTYKGGLKQTGSKVCHLEKRLLHEFFELICTNQMVHVMLLSCAMHCSYTPPIAEIICVKNVGAIVVCGFLMK